MKKMLHEVVNALERLLKNNGQGYTIADAQAHFNATVHARKTLIKAKKCL